MGNAGAHIYDNFRNPHGGDSETAFCSLAEWHGSARWEVEGIDCFAASAVYGLPIWVWRRVADVSAGPLSSRDIEV
jgi:hypothetical protein